jgi:CDP-diglyceride synthetase
MAQNKKLTELTLEELIAKQKTLKGAFIGLGIVMLIACIALIYLALKSNNLTLIVIAICCSITLLPSFIALSQINNEIKSRNSK